jgi:hypothetical protein
VSYNPNVVWMTISSFTSLVKSLFCGWRLNIPVMLPLNLSWIATPQVSLFLWPPALCWRWPLALLPETRFLTLPAG